MTAPSRRAILQAALAGGALSVAASLPGCADPRRQRVRHADATGELTTSAFITVLPSGVIALTVHKAEIGQGVTTAYATLVAEELEVEPGDLDLHFGEARPEFRTTGLEGVPMFAIQATGGSTSTAEGYLPLRRAAAATREVLIAAAAARWGVPARECAAKAGQIHHAATGRALGYGALTHDAARQPLPDDPPLKPAASFRLIGKHGARVDGYAKVTGAATFGIDVVVPDMVCAAAIHGPQYGARAKAVRDAAARRSPGVIDVLSLPWGVAVVAAKFWQAQRAARLVEIDWHDGATAGLDSDAMLAAARAHAGAGAAVRDDGDAGAAIARAPKRIAAVYEAPFLAHATLEPQNCVAAVRGRAVEIWAPCQSPSAIQEVVAEALDVRAADVRVHTTFAGGGFGRRLLADYAAQAATIARRVGRPVKLIWDRASDMTQGYYRPANVTHVRGAIDAAGRMTGLAYHNLSQPITVDSAEAVRGGMPRWLPALSRHLTAQTMVALTAANTMIDLFATEGAHNTPYRVPHVRVAYTPIATGLPVASWRSVGNSVNGFVIEGLVDELAHLAGADPYQFRRAHLASGSRELRVLDAVATLAGWGQAPPAGHAWGIARHTAFGTEAAQVAEVAIVAGRIRVTRVWCAVECGQVVNPDLVRAQLEGGVVFGLSAALDQAITLADGVVQQRTYDQFPPVRMADCPRIEVAIVPSDAAPTGVGEPGVPPIAPAVANAIFALTGRRLRRMPLQRAYQEWKP
ncbi:MAG: xanthine dehydrogenase family protein molybdopterin-binding subunit [Myxococcales bacterium]|nr:xanthine dehydrogenase family protein molybdopterin-binding subunit [Myxococcales bacterium]MBP6845952.1 xanthine dehydrogenase family protein molybdopterin-binding subunit [Kofleriaceae bacterium]